jgi:Fe-S cluster assembly scaffold protein SufB
VRFENDKPRIIQPLSFWPACACLFASLFFSPHRKKKKNLVGLRFRRRPSFIFFVVKTKQKKTFNPIKNDFRRQWTRSRIPDERSTRLSVGLALRW